MRLSRMAFAAFLLVSPAVFAQVDQSQPVGSEGISTVQPRNEPAATSQPPLKAAPTGSPVAAGDVTAGTFGSLQGGGTYAFSGALGVGTTSPNTLMDVSGGIFTVGATPSTFNYGTANRLQLELYNQNSSQSIIRSYNRGTTAYGDIGIGELGRFIVSAGGNIGINNSGPNTLLDISGGVLTVGGTGSTFGSANRLQLELYNQNTSSSIIRSYNRGVSAYGDIGIGELTRFMVQGATGNVGIGTSNPLYTLDVAGTIHATNVIGATYQDLAEWVPSSGRLPAGTVVILDAQHNNSVKASDHAYDTAVAGVVSDHPGIELGEPSASKSRVATTGRVKVFADASKHPIAIGDLLVTSDIQGTVMVSEPIDLGGVKIHRPGTLVGKALEPLSSGKGEILVLLSLQ